MSSVGLNQNSSKMFTQLPLELFAEIACKLSVPDILHFSLTCSAVKRSIWSDAVASHAFLKIDQADYWFAGLCDEAGSAKPNPVMSRGRLVTFFVFLNRISKFLQFLFLPENLLLRAHRHGILVDFPALPKLREVRVGFDSLSECCFPSLVPKFDDGVTTVTLTFNPIYLLNGGVHCLDIGTLYLRRLFRSLSEQWPNVERFSVLDFHPPPRSRMHKKQAELSDRLKSDLIEADAVLWHFLASWKHLKSLDLRGSPMLTDTLLRLSDRIPPSEIPVKIYENIVELRLHYDVKFGQPKDLKMFRNVRILDVTQCHSS